VPAKLDRLTIIGRLYPLKDACVLSGSRADLKQRISELRDALDALHMKAMTPVELPDGSLDYAGPLKDYEAQAQKIIRTVSGQAKHPLAQRATLDSLSSYAQAQRGKLATIAREQAQKNAQAIAMNRADAVLRDGTLSAEERRNELLIAAKQFQVATGDPVEALKFFEKATRDGATFDWLSRVNVAESESDLDGLMQNLQTEGRALGPQGALQIRAEIDRKRESMVKAQNAAQMKQLDVQVQRDKEHAQMQADLQVKMAELDKDAAKEAQRISFEREKLAHDAQMKREELALKRDLELLKLNATANEDGSFTSAEGQRNEVFAASLENLANMIQTMAAQANMPRRVVRDANGDIVGVEPHMPETVQ